MRLFASPVAGGVVQAIGLLLGRSDCLRGLALDHSEKAFAMGQEFTVRIERLHPLPKLDPYAWLNGPAHTVTNRTENVNIDFSFSPMV